MSFKFVFVLIYYQIHAICVIAVHLKPASYRNTEVLDLVEVFDEKGLYVSLDFNYHCSICSSRLKSVFKSLSMKVLGCLTEIFSVWGTAHCTKNEVFH